MWVFFDGDTAEDTGMWRQALVVGVDASDKSITISFYGQGGTAGTPVGVRAPDDGVVVHMLAVSTYARQLMNEAQEKRVAAAAKPRVQDAEEAAEQEQEAPQPQKEAALAQAEQALVPQVRKLHLRRVFFYIFLSPFLYLKITGWASEDCSDPCCPC